MKDVKFTELANFQPKQLVAYKQLLWNQICKYMLYGGAAGGGKSYFLRWCAVGLAFYYTQKYNLTGVPIGLFSEDYPTLRDRQMVKIDREFPRWLGRIRESQIYGLAFEAKPEYGSWVIMLRNLDDPSKYSSVEFAAILVEELTKNRFETFDDLRGRLRYPGIPDPKFVGATNPGQVGHGWVKRLWIAPDPDDEDPEKERFFFVPAKYSDNTFIDQVYEKQLLGIKDPQKRKALLEGSWDLFEGQVFVEFSQDRHVTNKFEWSLDNCQKIICFDWGYNAPGCALWIAFGPENLKGVSRAYVYREIYQNGKDPEAWAKSLKTVCDLEVPDYMVLPHDCFSKLGGRKSVADTFREILNIPIVSGRTLDKNARLNRLAITHQYLGKAEDGIPYMLINPRCKNLIRTLPDLVYGDTDASREDVNTKGEDHAYDALSLGLMTAISGTASSGAVKAPSASKLPRRFIVSEQGEIAGQDFWTAFKERAGRERLPKNPEFK